MIIETVLNNNSGTKVGGKIEEPLGEAEDKEKEKILKVGELIKTFEELSLRDNLK